MLRALLPQVSALDRDPRVESALGRSRVHRRRSARRSHPHCRSSSNRRRCARSRPRGACTAHRRRRIDFPARRRAERSRPADVIRFEIRSEMQRAVHIACLLLILVGVSPARAQPPSGPPAAARPARRAAQAPAAPGDKQPATIKSDYVRCNERRARNPQGNFETSRATRGSTPTTPNTSSSSTDCCSRATSSLAQGEGQISADRADFNTDTKIGIFYNARGSPASSRRNSRSVPADPRRRPTSNQPTDVYFFGDTVEKIGPRKYRITNGGFTTCVQPTPRWDLHADTRRAERRSLHDPEERGADRQRRADALPSGHVLPHQEGRPRDRFPAADLRIVHAARPADSQRVLLGDRSQPGRDDSSTSGIRRSARASPANTATTSAAATTAT